MDFYFCQQYQVQIAFWLGVGACVYFLLNAGTPSGLSRCRSCTGATLSEFICTSVLLCLEDSFPGAVPRLWLLQSLRFLFPQIPEPRGEALLETLPSLSLPAHCLVVVPIYCKKLLVCRFIKTQIYGLQHQKSLLPCSFNINNNSGRFSFRLVAYLFPVLGHFSSVKVFLME